MSFHLVGNKVTLSILVVGHRIVSSSLQVEKGEF